MGSDTRGVSNLLGVVLLFGIVVVGMVVIVVLGTTAINETRDQLDTSRAEKTLTQFDSKSAMVALGGTSNQQVDFGNQGAGYDVDDDVGWMNVTVENTTTGEVTTLLNVSLGAVTYENEESSIAYQGGGVWKRSDSGTSMISPPEFHFRNATLTLPVIVVDGKAGLGSQVAVSKNGTTRKRFPNKTLDKNFTNPLENGKVTVTVHSGYYEGWGGYFQQRTEGEVKYDHDKQTAAVTLVVPVSGRTVSSALAATSASGTLTLDGSGSEVGRTDSYTSADGDGYTGDNHAGGNISVAGTIDLGGNACVVGSIRADRVEVSGNANNCASSYKITNNVYYETTANIDSSDYGGTLQQYEGVEADSRIDSLVDDRVEQYRTNPNVNTNGEYDATNEEFDFSGDNTAQIGAGVYYVKTLDIGDGETLDVDTSGGTVAIAVKKDVSMNGDAKIQVSGNGQLKVYVKGEGVGTELTMQKDSGDSPQVQVPNRNSSQFWIYGKSDFSGTLKGSTEDVIFEGVLYAPGGTGGTGSIGIEKAEVYGGIVASNVDVSQGGEFHYDRALSKERVIDPNANVVAITYLHVTINRVNVTSG